MYNFPMPYPDELLYSTVARAGVRMGITSPKELLEEVFGDKMIVATPDLPGHLRAIARHYPKSAGLSVEALAYRHTLFPLYAPFVQEERRQRCLSLLARNTCGKTHLGLGVAASRIKQPSVLRACPGCVGEQIARYGEPYWRRDWQIRGANSCSLHGKLVETRSPRYGIHRHSFDALTPALFPQGGQKPCSKEDLRLGLRIRELLDMRARPSPSYDQWSQFYSALASDQGCAAGRHMVHSLIQEKILAAWPNQWLTDVGLPVTDSPSCWLRALFQKHRKAISYLEHLIVLEAFLHAEWQIQNVVRQVARLPKARPAAKLTASQQTHLTPGILDKRQTWQFYLKRYGVKNGRRLGGGAAYSSLYRRDRDWLLQINKRYRAGIRRRVSRVDWGCRDLELFEKLRDIKRSQPMGLDSPRQSKRWYLAQIGRMTSIVKHLDKLPLTSAFLATCSEDIEAYQVRRIRVVMRTLVGSGIPLKRWRILRAAGLNEIRLKTSARDFLNEVE